MSEARINAITAESKARLGAINAVNDLKLKHMKKEFATKELRVDKMHDKEINECNNRRQNVNEQGRQEWGLMEWESARGDQREEKATRGLRGRSWRAMRELICW
jgi:hypothetical protein